ncbi:hypothetical protein Q0590_28485 [Rhodocytophaga aerolata]|uniref:Class I SAM-dependent methyltransferase n=1 Tax=Rhodocytophaga aerolata TaxID=455078 RepID=A0ABT8RHT2_9BACT|nr:hypothetical protein [Rhodocytophaga aerolata]MDO1450252.1 hypothetical protein [Rhodocytophaga aerolata]
MKNIFCEEEFSALSFSPGTITYIKEHLQELKDIGFKEEEILLNYLTDKAIKSLCQANQFYYLNSFDRSALRKVYNRLLTEIKSLTAYKVEERLQNVATQHYRTLKVWVKNSNPFSKRLYSATQPYLEQEVVCGEYSALTQLQLLDIDVTTLQEPILDIGCGQQAFLVKYLRGLKLKAFGVDRNAVAKDYIFQLDWFEFNLSSRNWGTIISNLGFSNHFQYHHLRANSNYLAYAVRYKEMLQSLERGGAFYYAPDLPFIEQYLDPAKFQLRKVIIKDTTYRATKIVKL